MAKALAYEQMDSCQRKNSACPGTDGPERIVGTNAHDHINGQGGDDFLEGAGGNDDLDGGRGRDSLFGRIGDDRLDGGLGGDEIEGGRGDDTIVGGDGSDEINGGLGRDTIAAGPGQRHHPRRGRRDRRHRLRSGSRPRREGQPRPYSQLRDRALTKRDAPACGGSCPVKASPGRLHAAGPASGATAVRPGWWGSRFRRDPPTLAGGAYHAADGDRAHRARAARPPRAGRGRRLRRPDDAGHRARGRAGAGADHPEAARRALRARRGTSSRSPCSTPARASWPSPRRACGASGGPVLDIEGEAAALLSAERTALNLLQRLSGVATLTARYVEAVRGTRARVLDTRKTTPGLRMLEKAAVAAGGGTNHRIGLFDAILIKENHAAMAGGVGEAVRKARAGAPDGTLVEVECRDDAEVDEALAAGRRADPAGQHEPGADARDRRPRGRARRARGQRRDRPRDDQGRRRDRGRLHIGRCPHALGPRPRPLTSPGARCHEPPHGPA